MHEASSALVDVAVLEFPAVRLPLAGDLATELASLDDAELIHILDIVVVERRDDGSIRETGPEVLGEMGDLVGIVARLRRTFGADDIGRIADGLAPGHLAVAVAWENTWADPLVTLARGCGGHLVVDHRVAPVRSTVDDDD